MAGDNRKRGYGKREQRKGRWQKIKEKGGTAREN
jgi:hypothetical protein